MEFLLLALLVYAMFLAVRVEQADRELKKLSDEMDRRDGKR